MATKRPSDKAITMSSCINTAQLLQVAHLDEPLHSEVDLAEEFGAVSLCIVGLQLLAGLIYTILRLVKWYKNTHGQLKIDAVPVVLHAPAKAVDPPVIPTHPHRNFVYFGYV